MHINILIPGRKRAQEIGRKRMAFEAQMPLRTASEKSFTAVKDKDGAVIDYLDVRIRGYISTWVETTPSDRVGDYVLKGAFAQTIPRFMKNPVLLVDHDNRVEGMAGSFTVLKEDDTGLYCEAVLSNSPCDEQRHRRCLVAEGHLKTLSMGGIFHYEENRMGIFRVDLWEASLVTIPANPDALITVRGLTDQEKQKLDAEMANR